MKFETAARIQYRHSTFYVVFLVGPNGQKEHMGSTQIKSGRGLMAHLRMDHMQERVKQFPNVESISFRKYADRLEFSNGWRLEFGGTLRQEAK